MALKPEAAARKDKTTGKDKMQHRHFATVAAILRDLPGSPAYIGPDHHRETCEHFADHLADTNPKFDRERFLVACGVKEIS